MYMTASDHKLDIQIQAIEGEWKLLFLDATRAHFHSPQTELIFVDPPPERARAGYCWQLLKSMYGTRRAGHNWEVFYADIMVAKLGFTRGLGCPCLFVHQQRRIRCWVHGDDFAFLGTLTQLMWVEAEIGKHIAMKRTGLLGSGPGEDKEVRCLNRLIRYDKDNDLIEWECDPRHVELIISGMGLNPQSKGVSTPGVAIAPVEPSVDEALKGAQATHYRGVTMRAAYISQDRPELLFATKEAARNMQNPTASSLEKLKRLARYLVAHPRVVQVFRRQGPQSVITQLTDSDHAGCKVTRRSTSAGVSMHGGHMLAAFSTTQKPIATSSGESEFYGMFKSGSRLVGLLRMSEDFGLERQGVLRPDATAGIGIANRLGVGKIRHLHTQSLWLQRAVAEKAFEVRKIDGTVNASDLPTKHVDGITMRKHLETMGFVFKSGKSRLAIEVAKNA